MSLTCTVKFYGSILRGSSPDKTLEMSTIVKMEEFLEGLSIEKLQDLQQVVRNKIISKREQEILQAAKEAQKEHEEGKTISLSSPEEIIKFFNDLMKEVAAENEISSSSTTEPI